MSTYQNDICSSSTLYYTLGRVLARLVCTVLKKVKWLPFPHLLQRRSRAGSHLLYSPAPDRWHWYGGVLLRGVRSLSKKVWDLEPARGLSLGGCAGVTVTAAVTQAVPSESIVMIVIVYSDWLHWQSRSRRDVPGQTRLHYGVTA